MRTLIQLRMRNASYRSYRGMVASFQSVMTAVSLNGVSVGNHLNLFMEE